MKMQSNDNRGMMVSIGNQGAIAQRTQANVTKQFSSYFMFGQCLQDGSFAPKFGHTVLVSGWLNIQQMENTLKSIGCSVKSISTGAGTFYCVC